MDALQQLLGKDRLGHDVTVLTSSPAEMTRTSVMAGLPANAYRRALPFTSAMTLCSPGIRSAQPAKPSATSVSMPRLGRSSCGPIALTPLTVSWLPQASPKSPA